MCSTDESRQQPTVCVHLKPLHTNSHPVPCTVAVVGPPRSEPCIKRSLWATERRVRDLLSAAVPTVMQFGDCPASDPRSNDVRAPHSVAPRSAHEMWESHLLRNGLGLRLMWDSDVTDAFCWSAGYRWRRACRVRLPRDCWRRRTVAFWRASSPTFSLLSVRATHDR